MKTLIGLSGSLRRSSYNTALLRAASRLLPDGFTLDLRTLDGIPLYNEDVETASGIPAAVAALKDALAGAQGLLIATPEYNNSIPGVLKNGIDWLTRPPQDIAKVFGGKPVALLGATPGNFGTLLSQTAWLPVLRTLGVKPHLGGRLMVSRAHETFDENGVLKSPAVEKQLREYLARFCKTL